METLIWQSLLRDQFLSENIMKFNSNELNASPLGKENTYTDQYDPSLLFAINRDGNRLNIGIDVKKLPFTGVDIWNGFDFTWLDQHGNPQFGVLTINIPADSPNLIESKSFKLYLFSFANAQFDSNQLIKTLTENLSHVSGGKVTVKLMQSFENFHIKQHSFSGINLDKLYVTCVDQEVNPTLLKIEMNDVVTELLCSDLLKSNCLVTGKPDWGSVRISYTGPKINHEGLLKYIISYRNHQGFHEQCIERIFNDILTICKPEKLVVEGRYTRRGGLDINPIRSNVKIAYVNDRLYRQ